MLSSQIHRIFTLALVLSAFAAIAVVAQAATPASGEISKAKPRLKWSGSTENSGLLAYDQMNADPEGAQCQSPFCDTFTMKVVDGGDIQIGITLDAEGDTGPGSAGLRITDPNGKKTFVSGESAPGTTFKHTIRGAIPGDYILDHTDSFVCCGSIGFTAQADMLGAAPAAGPTPGPTASPTPGPSTAGPAPKMTVSSAKGSARKLNRAKRIRATLKSNGTVNDVVVTLLKGRKKLGTGKLGALNGSGKVTVKFRSKLKRGTYVLAATGKDAVGRTVSARGKLRVSK